MRYLPVSIALLAIFLAVAFPWMKTPLIIGLSYGFAALGVSILVRAGQVSFGHAGFASVAGYAVAAAARTWPQVDALLLIGAAILAGLLTGVLVGIFMMRYRGIFFGMLNLALSMVLFSLLGKFYHFTGGTDGLTFERPQVLGQALSRSGYEMTLLCICAALVILSCALIGRFYSSPVGQALKALKTNEVRLEYLGISARTVFYKGYVASAGLCGLSGGMLALVQGLVTPEMGYWVSSGEYIFIAVLGGTLHPVGAFIGAIAFSFLKLFAASMLTGAWHFVMGASLLVMIFLAPLGLAPLLENALASFQKTKKPVRSNAS